MATVTSRANQQYLPLNLSNSRSSLKTLFRLRSRCSNGRGKGQIERVRARMAREGIRKWLRDSLPPPPHPMHTPKFSLSPSLFYWACQTGPVVRSTFPLHNIVLFVGSAARQLIANKLVLVIGKLVLVLVYSFSSDD